MLGLIVAALRARRAAALVMLVLAAVTMGAAVGAAAASGRMQRDAVTARIAAATPVERTLSVRSAVALGTQPDDIVGRFQALITGVPAERSVLGVRYSGVLRAGDELRLPIELRAVDGFCGNATMLQGRCPERDGEIVLPPDVARQLGLAVGDPLRQDGGSGVAVVPLTLVGLFAPSDPLGWYWSGLDGLAAYTTRGTVAKPGGAGFGLALACDFVVASTRARFGTMFLARGLSPDFATSWLLPRLVGLRMATRLCLLPEIFDAARARELGLLEDVVAPEELPGAVATLAALLAAGPPIATRLTKQLLRDSFARGVAESLAAETTAQAVNRLSADAQEGIAAFLERRPARFEGR